MTTCAVGIPTRCATNADAYSHGSRNTRSGDYAAHACSSSANIADVASRPNRSRFPSTDTSPDGTTGRRSRMGAAADSGGTPLASNEEAAS
jgi:hypothetical protein